VIDDVIVVTPPAVPAGATSEDVIALQRESLDDALLRHGFDDPVLWFYTPMAVPFTSHLQPVATVYDCMDELASFADAPPELLEREQTLLERADVVFTGGRSLYEAKRDRHPRVHAFPSSVDVDHFATARRPCRTRPGRRTSRDPGWAGRASSTSASTSSCSRGWPTRARTGSS
jgi:UDP-galactopyranose mutase